MKPSDVRNVVEVALGVSSSVSKIVDATPKTSSKFQPTRIKRGCAELELQCTVSQPCAVVLKVGIMNTAMPQSVVDPLLYGGLTRCEKLSVTHPLAPIIKVPWLTAGFHSLKPSSCCLNTRPFTSLRLLTNPSTLLNAHNQWVIKSSIYAPFPQHATKINMNGELA